MPLLAGAGRFAPPVTGTGAQYLEHLRTADLSVGTYSIRAGGIDGQSPHTEDEVYVVTAGRAQFVEAAGPTPVQPGDVLFVAANAEHRFVDVSEDFAVAVIFGPPESTRAPLPTA
jgi:mannose-6-phosphate isomerase-like protein (cupin superfamily)